MTDGLQPQRDDGLLSDEHRAPAGGAGAPDAGTADPVTPDLLVRTVPAHDELHRDGESLVLVDGAAQLVSMLGTLLREAAREGATVRQLADQLEDELGAPPEGSALDLTVGAVGVLLDAGLLERVD